MSKQQTVTGIVTSLRRSRTSYHGNPSWFVTINDTEYRTATDASIGYAIDNAEYRNEPHTFTLTKAGHISHVVR